MSCTRPIKAYRSKTGRNKETGNWPIVFTVQEGYKDLVVDVPCGRCVGCRLEKSRQWAVRCVHEAKCYKENCFVTLTYDNDNLPKDLSIDKEVIKKFMKRLRKKYVPKNPKKDQQIRYYLCGEYGEKFNRPHYHLCLFNHNFSDRVLYTVREGTPLYISNELMNLWPYGYSTIGDLTFESAAYVSRYVTKKITGDLAEMHYNGREPEFALMSRKPGIGKPFYDKYKDDMISKDRVIVRNDLQCAIPRYYNNIIKKEFPEKYKQLQKERRKKVDNLDFDELFRLDNVRNINFKKKSKRSYENV